MAVAVQDAATQHSQALGLLVVALNRRLVVIARCIDLPCCECDDQPERQCNLQQSSSPRSSSSDARGQTDQTCQTRNPRIGIYSQRYAGISAYTNH